MSINIKVKTTLSTSDIELTTQPSDSTKVLKENIMNVLRIFDESKSVRLIYNGKLLQPDSKFVSDFKIIPNSFVHAVVSTQQRNNEFDSIESLDHNDVISSSDSATIPHQGLNRLLGRGFSVTAVASIRSSFQKSIDSHSHFVQQRENETDDSYRLRVENRWMISQEIIGNNTQLRPSSSDSEENDIGTHRDFVFGFLVCVTVGFIIIFCVWDRNVTHRQKLGLLAGIAVSCFVEMISQEKMVSNNNTNHQSLRSN